ncbi:uncharacterized protein PAC_05424 [Phialocephala subalpina]|uniref:Heterokaryon incompatibility domain-containing protein n=1 Tax=Phialocephala subalpina TaxID=576137 RepID=A0A1L7WRY4_9HELO|nr:uncharacterized protein PAC_05424 [Phialocephala subalpina]
MPRRSQRRMCYQYRPLEPQNFRLLELVPHHSLIADLHCRLIHSSIVSAHSYEALSYTWGDGISTCRITLNGSPFYIRPNLREALRRLRQSKGKRMVWVDAICINQDCTEEKSIQVPLMRQIYAGAKRVIVWLGEDSFDSDKAIEFIPVLTEVARLDTDLVWIWHLSQDEFLRRMSSLIALFYRPWWRRTWIIQEVALPRSVILLCGSQRIHWSVVCDFVLAWMDIKFSLYLSSLYQRTIDGVQKTALRTLGMAISGFAESLTRMRLDQPIYLSPANSLKLSNLLWSYKNQDVSNPRDKIYGLLGLVPNAGVQIDYNKSVEDIYTSVFRSFLEEDGGFDTFRWMTGEMMVQKVEWARQLNLPSWVPDFGPRAVHPISSFIFFTEGPICPPRGVFQASGPNRSRSEFILQFEDGERTLVLRGYRFDTISQRGRLFPYLDEIVLSGYQTYPTFKHWEKLAMSTTNRPYDLRSSRGEAFWRTILTDRKVEGFHFQDNAGWIPARRLTPVDRCVPPQNSEQERELLRAIETRGGCIFGRRFCISSRGYFGLMPATACEGDMICVLLRGEVPFVLRRRNDRDQGFYQMIGECYVHGIMDGEVVKDALNNGSGYELFKLC